MPRLLDADKVLEALEHWSITMSDGTEWCDLTEALKAIRSLPCADTGEVERLRATVAELCDRGHEAIKAGVRPGEHWTRLAAAIFRARAALNKQEPDA